LTLLDAYENDDKWTQNFSCEAWRAFGGFRFSWG